MTRARLRLLKTIFLVAPLLLSVLLLRAYGAPVRSFFRSVATSIQFETEETDHFRIIWNVRTDYNNWAKSRLNDYVSLIQKNYRFPALPADRKITVYLVEREFDLERFGSIAEKPDAYPISTWVNTDELEIAVQVAIEEPHDTRKLCHALTHLFLHLKSPKADWSPWLEEGLALTFNLADNRQLAWILPEHLKLALAARQKGTFFPIRELVEVDPSTLSADRRRLYHREAHLLVSFLLETREVAFREYLETEARPGPATAAEFDEAFGLNEKLEEEWGIYLDRKNRGH